MRRIPKVILILLSVGVLLELGLMTAIYLSESIERPLEKRDVVILLGARIMPDGELSTTVLHRVQTALKVYKEGYASRIIVCGARGSDEPETEAGAMAKWLVTNGVPEADILVEDRSSDTIENLRNANALMEARGYRTAIIVTSNYHLTRALWLARDQGLDAAGAAAPGNLEWYNRLNARFRESLSWINYALGGVLKGLVFWR